MCFHFSYNKKTLDNVIMLNHCTHKDTLNVKKDYEKS